MADVRGALPNKLRKYTKSTNGKMKSRKPHVKMHLLWPLELSGTGIGGPTPVGIYATGATQDGIYDVAGNVMEWCADWYAPYDLKQRNPADARSGEACVARGGSWLLDGAEARSARRNFRPPEVQLDGLGFRVVFDSTIH